MEQLVTIELFDRPFSFTADSEVTSPQEVADFLAAEVRSMQDAQIEKSERISELAIMILTALNITNSKFEMKREQMNSMHDIFKKSEMLLKKIDLIFGQTIK